MSKLLPMICLLAVSAFLMSGGCTPEENQTWSEVADFSTSSYEDWSGWYEAGSSLDSDFVSITIYHTGSSIQGFDNMGRSWFGHIVPGDGPAVNIETSDGPRGVQVLAGNFYLIPTMDPEIFILGCGGQHRTTSMSGQFALVGPTVVIPLDT